MVFTEQQLQVKKLVDVQQDIEIDALNDGVNRVNSNVVKNSQDISAQSDRISDAETRIDNLETADTQIINTIDQIQTANGQAITDAVSAVMTSIGTQVTTEKVVAGDINIPNINSETPVESNKVLGYDAEGNIIPVEATFELGVPSNAAFLKTDENANVEAGVPDTTVTENSTNLVTSGAVYNAIDSAADTLDSKIDFTASGLSSRIDRIEDTQSMVIQNEPYQNKAVNKPGMRTIMYDPSDDETYWSDVNLVPPMDENTIGKFLTNNNNVPQWADVPNELPEYTTSDDGKSLKVKYNNGAAELEWKKDVPDYAAGDVGKVLTVKDNNGSTELGWESEKELPNFTTSQANKVLTVKNNNGTAEVAWENTQSTLPSTTGNANKVLTVNGAGDGVEWKANDTLSASDHSASKSYLVKGAGSDGDVAHYLRGDGTWGEVPNTLPDFGSTDAGKVLAINSNGTNTVWVANEPILPTASSSTLGGVKSATTGTIPYRDYNVQVNSNGTMKVNVPWTDSVYSLPTASSSEKGGVKLGADKLSNLDTPNSTSDAGRYYPIQTDKNDKLVVNVPWTVYSLPTANKDTLGGVKSATTGTTSGRDYNVEVKSDGTMKVNVPWTDSQYTLPTANGNTLGGVKSTTTGTTSGRDYNVQVNSDGTMKVNVPWTDTNTHNTAELRAGNNTSTSNEATDNGSTYLKIVDGGSKTSSLKISGSKGTTVKSDADGNITIESPNVTHYTRLDASNKNPSLAYTIKGAGHNANTKYYLAGDGNWVNGILVPVPTVGGKTLKSNADGTVYWG